VVVLARELELTLAAAVVALLLSFCSRQKLKRKQIPLLSTTIRIPFSSLPPVTQKSLSTFYAYVDFTFKAPLHSRLWLNWTDGYKRPLVESLSANLLRFGMEKVGKLESLQEIIADMADTDGTSEKTSADCPLSQANDEG
jgi:hypothetical protein